MPGTITQNKARTILSLISPGPGEETDQPVIMEIVRAVLDRVQDHVILTDTRGVILYVNRAFELTTGYSRSEALGNTPRILKSQHHDDSFYEEMWKTLVAGGEYTGEVVNRRKNGELYYDDRTIVPLVNRQGGVEYLLSVGREITKTHPHDPATDLPTRDYLVEKMMEANLRGGRGNIDGYALLSIDLRGFSRINSSHGYKTGDRILGIIAQRIQRVARDDERITCVAYMGADAFSVLVEQVENVVDVSRTASIIMLAIGEPIEIGDHSISIAASVGIAMSREDHEGPYDLLCDSESAIHQAKSLKTDAPVLFDAEHSGQLAAALETEARLHWAIEYGEIEAFYQPIYSIGKREIVGFEALARWHKADGEIVPPAVFIPIAETSGLIVSIGNQMLRQACHHANLWQRQFGARLKVSVNVSPVQFMRDDYVETVRATLRQTELEPSLLKLEITESATISDPDAVVTQMGRLRDLGVELLIDDFGTGYSSLQYLTQYPLDTLKIDRSFVMGAEYCGRKQAVISAVVSLAHGLGLKVIAEGVETAEQLALLHDHGCDQAQGYLLGKPVSAEETLHLIAEEYVPSVDSRR